VSKKPDLSASQILERLRNGPFQEPAHAWLIEVNNATGFTGGRQFADALVVSLWPSRGIWFAGVEVKVSRHDWGREVGQPTKSAEIQAFCDYWWVAAPVGVVPIAEVPETWELLEVDGRKVLRTKEAPKLSPKPPTIGFVASCLRNGAEALRVARQLGLEEGRQKAAEEFNPEKLIELQGKLATSERELSRVKQQLVWKEQECTNANAACREFERSAGLPEHTIMERSMNGFGMHSTGAHFHAAQMLAQLNVEHLAKQFEDVAQALRALPAKEDKC
jgi:hypothetical protein